MAPLRITRSCSVEGQCTLRLPLCCIAELQTNTWNCIQISIPTENYVCFDPMFIKFVHLRWVRSGDAIEKKRTKSLFHIYIYIYICLTFDFFIELCHRLTIQQVILFITCRIYNIDVAFAFSLRLRLCLRLPMYVTAYVPTYSTVPQGEPSPRGGQKYHSNRVTGMHQKPLSCCCCILQENKI